MKLAVVLGCLLLLSSFVSAQTSSTNPVLPIGTGWTGATSTPSAVGNSTLQGYTAKVIACWNTVPYRAIRSDTTISVVAFHMNGINRVEFSVNNGTWTSVTTPTYDSSSDTYSYKATLRPSDAADGTRLEVRARAYPNTAGIPRVLAWQFTYNGGGDVQGNVFYANSGQTMPSATRYVSEFGDNSNSGLTSSTAYATIEYAASQIQTAMGGDASGGNIILLPGTYTMPLLTGIVAEDRWFTIQGIFSSDADDIILELPHTSSVDNGIPDGLLKLSHLSIAPDPNFTATGNQVGSSGGGVWLDDVLCVGASHWQDNSGGVEDADNMPLGIFYTRSYFEEVLQPFTKITYIQSCEFKYIGVDLFKGPRYVINVHGDHHGYAGAQFEAHADFLQQSTDEPEYDENFILYNISSYDCYENVQGFYWHMLDGWTRDNIAHVNVIIDRDGDTSAASQFRCDLNGSSCTTPAFNHVLLWNITHDSLNMRVLTNIDNFSMVGCAWQAVPTNNFTLGSDDVVRNNHVEETAPSWGTNWTTGDPGYRNAVANDYHPDSTSTLRRRVNPNVTSWDVFNNTRSSPASAGAIECCTGDVNDDNIVDIDDYDLVLAAYGNCANCPEDVNRSGVVDASDLALVTLHWGSCP